MPLRNECEAACLLHSMKAVTSIATAAIAAACTAELVAEHSIDTLHHYPEISSTIHGRISCSRACRFLIRFSCKSHLSFKHWAPTSAIELAQSLSRGSGHKVHTLWGTHAGR